MLDNDADRPPLELRLPDELARCESMLSSLSLPPSRVQRDELMYRAGWAAAEARLPVSAPQGVEQASSARGTYRRRTLAWSLTSAVLAASTAVAITANYPGSAALPQVAIPETRSSDRPEMSVEAAPPPARQTQPIPREIARTTAVDWTAPLLVMRDRAHCVSDGTIHGLSRIDPSMPHRPTAAFPHSRKPHKRFCASLFRNRPHAACRLMDPRGFHFVGHGRSSA